jgi:hypothetical protein
VVRLRRLKSRLLAAAVVGVAASAGVAGCSPDEWGTAARIGDQRLSVEQLQQATAEVSAAAQDGTLTSQQSGARQTAILTLYTRLKLVDLAAARNGVSPSDAEVDAALANAGPLADVSKQAASQESIPPSWLRDVVRQSGQIQGLQQKLGVTEANPERFANEITAVAREAGVEINPRYGAYAEDSVTVQPAGSGGLSSAIPQPPLIPAFPSPSAQPEPAPAP